MFHVVLFEPEIPPNTGNVIRLCANTGCRLHLIEPLGFVLDDRKLRRAGLDYHEFAPVRTHAGYEQFLTDVQPARVLAMSTRGGQPYQSVKYRRDDAFVFGPETRGLPERVLASVPQAQRLRIPMVAGNRSLNLSNAVAVVVYEAWRQLGFPGAS
jgi:tRNA (cytidine/uridine-2'-O-)-methyltransferase